MNGVRKVINKKRTPKSADADVHRTSDYNLDPPMRTDFGHRSKEVNVHPVDEEVHSDSSVPSVSYQSRQNGHVRLIESVPGHCDDIL